MRQIVLDTETTGLEAELGHRIIEIGCVELVNRRPTGRTFHRYVNPERDIDAAALGVHGMARADLAREPLFADVADEFLAFIADAELVIHNAPFDVGFLDAELARTNASTRTIASVARVLDTLALARQRHPGQRNSLDALCKRYSVDNSRRDYHGALLDARLLADVYLAMTGGQAPVILSAEADSVRVRSRLEIPALELADLKIAVIEASEEELAAHEHLLALLDKASDGKTVWRTVWRAR